MSPSDKSSILDMLRENNPGYHPLKELADIAMDPETDVKSKIDCHKTIVKYCEAELKSVEVNANVKGDLGMLRVIVDNSDSELPPA
jgi:hypothetical protein